MNLPQLLVHAVIPHGHQPLLAPADDLPVIHLDCGHPQLMGGQGQGDFITAEVMEPDSGRCKRSIRRRGLVGKPAAPACFSCVVLGYTWDSHRSNLTHVQRTKVATAVLCQKSCFGTNFIKAIGA